VSEVTAMSGAGVLQPPLAVPHLTASASRTASLRAADGDRLARWIVFTPLVAATLLSKFSVPPFGSRGVGLVFPLTMLALCAGLLFGRLHFAPRRLIVFLFVMGVLGLMQFTHDGAYSLGSLALMMVIGIAYLPVAEGTALSSENARDFFCDVSALTACLGIAQSVLQFVVGQRWAFPIEALVPAGFRVENFNSLASLYYGSTLLRSNGVVMLEPSVFSQLCALGLLAELIGKMRMLRLAAYVGALVVAYSGTGFVILAVTLPLLVVIHRRVDLLLYGAVVVVIALVFAEPLHLDTMMHRAGELNSTGSSGFARFVSWQTMFEQRLWNSDFHALLGNGAGSFAEAGAAYGAAEMAHSKIIFEFGLLGSVLYFGFIFYCIFSSPAPFLLRVGVAVGYFMNGAYSPTITGIVATLLLWPGPPLSREHHDA
jgi:hypothetical protein